MSTLPHSTGTDRAPRSASPSAALDLRTDEGLRHAVRAVGHSDSWDQPAGRRLLAELRRHAVRSAAHVAAATGTPPGRGLVDDLLPAAWLVLRRHGDKVFAAARPRAYLMSSAQKQVLDEIRAQQLLTNTASIRGRAREVPPSVGRPVGSTATDLATALRHELTGAEDSSPEQVVRQIGQHERPPLATSCSEPHAAAPVGEREPWFIAFIDLLVSHGADQPPPRPQSTGSPTCLPPHTSAGGMAARRDLILAKLGLTPDQCGALVALVAGSRRYRHNGKHDSLLAAVRTATERGHDVELSPAQRRRLATFTGAGQQAGQPVEHACALAVARGER